MSQQNIERIETETDTAEQPPVSLKHWGDLPDYALNANMTPDCVLDCGWGRLIFAQTFQDVNALVDFLKQEEDGFRDIAFYLRDPHVILSLAPQDLFLDPSHAFRLNLADFHADPPQKNGFSIRVLEDGDIPELQAIYKMRQMVPPPESFFTGTMTDDKICLFVAVDNKTGKIIGGVTGVDHVAVFNDIDNGSSLWALAVDPQAPYPGVGEKLSKALALHFKTKERAFMDLSVMYNNEQAIALYKKLGFEQIPVYCLKKKNNINEKLFIGPAPEEELNVYAGILVDEARRRGIHADVLDAEGGFYALSHGGRTIMCRESLSELTSAVSMSMCDDKAVTRRFLRKAGLRVPEQISVKDDEQALDFLKQHGRVVVKTARGEQGHGVYVDLRSEDEVLESLKAARDICSHVIMEEFVAGQDLRIVIIDEKLVVAAVRKPAEIVGDGQHNIRALIEKTSRRRAAATGGESRIPFDAETERCIRQAGYEYETVLDDGQIVTVRKTANLHTGGTIHDVTDILNPLLEQAAIKAAQTLKIPVVGFDFLVPSPEGDEYVIIEANERPGLANHEPAPTAERFIDLLFPQTKGR